MKVPYSIHTVSTERDLSYALSIRAIVFVEEQACPFTEEFDRFDTLQNEQVTHLLIKDKEEPVATARMIHIDRNHAKIGRIAALKTFRRKGLGTFLLKHMIHRLKTEGYTDITVNAQEHLQSFYENLGFQREGNTFDEAGIPHIRMNLHLT